MNVIFQVASFIVPLKRITINIQIPIHNLFIEAIQRTCFQNFTQFLTHAILQTATLLLREKKFRDM